MQDPPRRRTPPGFVFALRNLAAETFGLTDREQRAIVVVLGVLLLGCLVRYGRFLGVSA